MPLYYNGEVWSAAGRTRWTGKRAEIRDVKVAIFDKGHVSYDRRLSLGALVTPTHSLPHVASYASR